MVDRPSGTVTFLFSDIVDSTRLWEERPEDMRVLVAEHDARFRAAIEANDGYVVKTTGDGVHAAFGRAAEAVAAAEQAQASIADLPEIEARMGLNTGEVQERDGDYFGPPVNRAARLMAAGHGGQVLLSAVTADLVPGLVLTNLGEHRLRDLGSPMPIWQLGTDQFPGLRTLDDLPGNLPVQRTSFVGRADEVKELVAMIETERLVTLTGSGGVGKSRLALQVAADASAVFSDGSWFASLASLEEGALVAASVLEAFGVPERRGEPAVDTLCLWSRSRNALVVIDNCEHLLADVAQVVDRLVEASSTVAVLATSQAPLGVRGEHIWVVAPLSGPQEFDRDSVELFVDRARMARADFVLTDDNERAVAEVCDRLDHVPLAIELAAARVRGMSPADIASRLDQRLRLFASADRQAPGRHRTLDAAVRWSYELLDQTQQRLFDRLSVFAGPFTIEAAESIVTGDGVEEWDVLDGIMALVDKSLVVVDETAGDTRYRLLETMRQFGSADLAIRGDESTYRQRHADHYGQFVLSRRAALLGADDQPTLNEIKPELENIRVAMRHATDDHTSSRYEEIYTALFILWMGRGRSLEGATWAMELASRPTVDPRATIVALGVGAHILNSLDLDAAEELSRAAEALSASTGAAPPLMALAARGLIALMQGRTDEAVEVADRVVALAPEEPDLFIRAQSMAGPAAIYAVCRLLDRLRSVDRDLVELYRVVDNEFLSVSAGGAVAPVLHLIDPDHAGARLRRLYDLNAEIGNPQANVSHAMFVGFQELRDGNLADAASWTRTALEVAVDHAHAFIAQVINTVLAVIKRRSPVEAARLLGALRAHRARQHLAGTQLETEYEDRCEASLRHVLGDDFDAAYADGTALDEAAMLSLAFAQLDAILAEANA